MIRRVVRLYTGCRSFHEKVSRSFFFFFFSLSLSLSRCFPRGFLDNGSYTCCGKRASFGFAETISQTWQIVTVVRSKTRLKRKSWLPPLPGHRSSFWNSMVFLPALARSRLCFPPLPPSLPWGLFPSFSHDSFRFIGTNRGHGWEILFAKCAARVRCYSCCAKRSNVRAGKHLRTHILAISRGDGSYMWNERI